MACTSGRASDENTAVPMKIRAPAGSPMTGSLKMSTCVTSMLSNAQPVTGIAPTTPVVPSIGVSKLPNGSVDATLATFTWMVCGELIAPAAATVTIPLDPGAAEIWNVPVPTPDPGFTAMLEWSEVAVQATLTPPLMVTRMVCG